MAGPAQPAEALGRRGVRQGGRVGAEAGGGGGGGGERAVCGAEIAAACVEDHSSERSAEGWRGGGHRRAAWSAEPQCSCSSSARCEGRYEAVITVWGEVRLPCALLYLFSVCKYLHPHPCSTHKHSLTVSPLFPPSSQTPSSYYNESFWSQWPVQIQQIPTKSLLSSCELNLHELHRLALDCIGISQI